MTHTASLQLGYIGEQGQHIEDYGNVNQWTVNNDQTSAPFYNSPYIGVNGVDSALGVGGSGGLLITESRAMMNYNALQAVIRQRLSHGLEFTVNYTWGKAMTNSLGNYALNVNGFSGAFQNYYNSRGRLRSRPATTFTTTFRPSLCMPCRSAAVNSSFPAPTALSMRSQVAGSFRQPS